MDNQIQLSGEFIREEAIASGIVKPGMLVELTSADADTVRAHNDEGGIAETAFAVEDALQGKTTADAYASGALVSYNIAQRGARVNALIKGGSSVTKGEKLISAGDGTLIPADEATSVATIQQYIATAIEAFDDSADGLSPVRVL